MEFNIFNRCELPESERDEDILCASQTGWHHMALMYTDAAIKLANTQEDCEQSHPIIFLTRHAIELTIKSELLNEHGRISNEDLKLSHNLSLLIGRAIFETDIFDQVDLKDIFEFHKMDPGSYSYRYPVDTKGNNICEHGHCIGRDQLISFLQTLQDYLEARGPLANDEVLVTHFEDETE